MAATGLTRLLVFSIATVLAVSSVTTSPVAARPEPDPHYAEPVVGECHDYSYADVFLASDRSPAQVCDGSQRAHTIAVVTIPARIAMDSPRLSKYWHPQCEQAFSDALGGSRVTRALSSFVLTFFLPTKAQRRHGAHWVRCDVVLLGGRRAFAPVPTDLSLGPRPLDDSVARCKVFTGGGVWPTVCARRHELRAVKAFRMTGSRYPGIVAVDRAAIRHCPDMGVDLPSQDSWRAGHKVVVCYTGSTDQKPGRVQPRVRSQRGMSTVRIPCVVPPVSV